MELSRDGLRRRSGGGRVVGFVVYLFFFVDFVVDLVCYVIWYGVGFYVFDWFDVDGFESFVCDVF